MHYEDKNKSVIKQIKCANINIMKKQDIIKLLGNAPTIAKRLGYAHRNIVYGWPDKLSDRQSREVIIRMKAKRIKVPPEWEKSLP